MNYWIRKIWSLLVPSSSEQSNQSNLAVKHMPYDNAYFFTHVPKTGGTSFIVFLDRFFPAKSIFPHQLWIDIGDFNVIDRTAYHLVRGHFGGAAIDIISEKDIQFLTILRDPVKLTYSTYEFVRREKNTALHSLVVGEKMSFEAFLEHPKTKHLITNRMVHNLSFGIDYDQSVKSLHLSHKTFPEFRKKMNSGQAKYSDADRLKMGQEFLDKCLWYGILEEFNHAVRLLCYKMAWPPLGQSQKLNINKIPPVITDAARSKVLELNQLDSKLYEYAKNKFSAEVKSMYKELGAGCHDDSASLDDLIDQHYIKNHTKKYNIKPSEEVQFDNADILLGNQWHRREWNSFDKKYFRWSGPGEISWIDFWVKPNNFIIKVSIIDSVSLDLLNTMKVTVNNEEVEVSSNSNSKVRTLQFTCAQSMIKSNGLLRIAFVSKNLKPHKNLFDSDDGRVVGFALQSIQITVV
jgi:hypothetical protein